MRIVSSGGAPGGGGGSESAAPSVLSVKPVDPLRASDPVESAVLRPGVPTPCDGGDPRDRGGHR
eukprot:532863-Prymnesium_polylepis.1